MAKYYKFHYDAGYCGTDVDEVFKYDDDISENQVQSDYEDWYEAQRSDIGDFAEISEEEAEELGVDEDLTESEE